MTDKLRKEISYIVQGEIKTLYEYWERFHKLLDSCLNHTLDTQVLLGYVCQGMREQDRNLLDASSNGSLSKYRTAEEACQLIADLAESTQHARWRVNRPKSVNEVSSSGEIATITKTLCEMTSLLKQLQVNQQQPPSQQQPLPPQHQQCQQLVPQKVCGICSCYSHYTDECPSLQEDNTIAATHNFYDRPYYERANQGYHSQGRNYNQGYPQHGGNYNQGSNNSNQGWRDNYEQGGRDNGGNQRWNNNTSQNRYSQNPPNQQPNQGRSYQAYIPPYRQLPQPNQHQAPQITYPSTSPTQNNTLRSILQGQKDLQNTLNSSINGLISTFQALISRMEPPSTSTPQTPNPSAIPSQPLPNPKDGINAVTLRSETQLKERDSKASSPLIVAQEKDGVEIEEIEEEEAHVEIEDEDLQPRSEVPRKEQVLEEVAQPIPFPTLAKKAKKRMELDPKMVEMFKKVEVTIPLFDAIHQVPKYAKFLMDLCMNKDRIHELETIPLGSSISALMGPFQKSVMIRVLA
ncbi:uncharacterized protein [Arachis hypogaea]|uniref:uncharacterized protein n=1 Tax=Arachis hypogaea TaxID=3818 RepID=UPI000DEC04B4|nr:signal transducer and activator of transcription A-like [Arachis hypogaea]